MPKMPPNADCEGHPYSWATSLPFDEFQSCLTAYSLHKKASPLLREAALTLPSCAIAYLENVCRESEQTLKQAAAAVSPAC